MKLWQVRQLAGLKQSDVGQQQLVARWESLKKPHNFTIKTLKAYFAACGAEMEIYAKFSDGTSVRVEL